MHSRPTQGNATLIPLNANELEAGFDNCSFLLSSTNQLSGFLVLAADPVILFDSIQTGLLLQEAR